MTCTQCGLVNMGAIQKCLRCGTALEAPPLRTCPACRGEIPPDSEMRFCLHCGVPLPKRCIPCRRDVPAQARFCPYCGAVV